MFTAIYQGLRQVFQESWFKFLFKYTALAKLLSKNETPSAWVFFRTYLSSWWWNRLWFRSRVQNHLKQFDAILEVLQVLKMSGVLTEENCNSVSTHDDPYSLLVTFFDLQESEILNQVNFERVIAHACPRDLSDAFYRLQQAGMFNQVNFVRVTVHPKPWFLAQALSFLQVDGILNQDNFVSVATHVSPVDLSFALSFLQESRILNQDNFALVAAHPSLGDLTRVLPSLELARILNQDNFTALLASNHANLVSEEANRLIWERIPSQFLTQENFQRLLTAAEVDDNPMTELERVVNQILGINFASALDLPDVSASEAAHQACLDEQIRLSLNEQGLVRRLAQHSIWDNRDSSADARRNFDNQYGLVLRS